MEGPLTVHDVTKNSCVLKWKPPEDDGGKPITHYTIEKMDKDNGRWVPCGRTDGPLTEYKVKGLQEGHEYKFRVRACNDEGESEPLENEAAIKAKDPYGEGSQRLEQPLFIDYVTFQLITFMPCSIFSVDIRSSFKADQFPF